MTEEGGFVYRKQRLTQAEFAERAARLYCRQATGSEDAWRDALPFVVQSINALVVIRSIVDEITASSVVDWIPSLPSHGLPP